MPLAWHERWLARALRHGAVPEHVAFVMDGNRRHAREVGLARARGHQLGYDKLVQVLEFCLELGVRAVTVFAFSIENLKRSHDEVAELMSLAADKFNVMCGKGDIIQRHGVRLRILGDLALVAEFPHVQRAMERAVRMSSTNTGVLLNVAFAYTARHEMQLAAGRLAALDAAGLAAAPAVSEAAFGAALETAELPPPQMIVRTSGEVRLSDFLLWQGRHSFLAFTAANWPSLSMWRLALLLLQYQRVAGNVAAAQRALRAASDSDPGARRSAAFVAAHKRAQWLGADALEGDDHDAAAADGAADAQPSGDLGHFRHGVVHR